MGRLIGRRLLLMVPTLILVSILVFALAEVLPGNVGRFILGPYATQSAVDQLNHSLGMDKPIYTRYVEWAGHFVTGHWGTSYQYTTPVFPLVMRALGNSLLLAGFALVIIVPTSILVGVYAGLRRDSLLDRAITISSLSMTVIPEFVSGVILIVVFAVTLHWLPVQALPPQGAGDVIAEVDRQKKGNDPAVEEQQIGALAREPAAEPCPYANVWETCPNFVTTSAFAPAIKDQLADIRELRDDAKRRGWTSEIRRHERVIGSLEGHLRRLTDR